MEMVGSCRGCKREIPELASYCPICGVPVKASKLDEVETDYRRKLVHVSWWEVWSQLDKGIIKTMPTILIANGVLIAVAWMNGESLYDEPKVTEIAMITLSIFLYLFASSIILSEIIENQLTKYTRQASIQKSEVVAYSTMANEYFKEFNQDGMARIGYEDLRNISLTADGKIYDFTLRPIWQKSKSTPMERQKDMRHADENLVKRMDKLNELASSFIQAFNEFSGLVAPYVGKILRTYDSHYAPEAAKKGGFLGMYMWLSGIIKDDVNFREAHSKGLIGEDTREFIEYLFKHIHSGNIDIGNDDLKNALAAANVTKTAQDTAIAHRDELKISLEAKEYMFFS